MYEFQTTNTTYVITPIFGVMFVQRIPRWEPDLLPTTLVVDEALCVPCTPEGSVLEDRKVVFRKDGRNVLATSYADSRAYLELPWGSWEDGLIRSYQPM